MAEVYYSMEKILIDIDNQTPGAIIRNIFEFIRPKCPVGLDPKGTLCLVNKYFHKTIRSLLVVCNVENIFDRDICKIHSSDYNELKTIHDQMIKAKRRFSSPRDYTLKPWDNAGVRKEYIHFDTKQMADKAVKYVRNQFLIVHRCCRGKGMLLRNHCIV
tara:strand:+ start:998 stop:1474 length:477 start_codon:yes stop_codon:yes gene_type:complete